MKNTGPSCGDRDRRIRSSPSDRAIEILSSELSSSKIQHPANITANLP
ncbi:hypothetical protein JJD41_03440 [Oxynema sp. CENA135]|nr:hypothetical protein [Oxynema sp. CENA135]MBK4728946.1 hypothetical protein [Oxynema sp. CENA135]